MPLVESWWSRWPSRYETEMAAYERRGLVATRDETGWEAGRLVVRLQVPTGAGDEVADVKVVYPNTFPHTRFEVYATNLVLDRHQNPFGGNLCLLPRSSEHWRPSICAADVIADGLADLVALVRAGGDELRAAEEPQGEPISAFLDAHGLLGVVVPDADVDPEVDYGTLRLRVTDSRLLELFARAGKSEAVITSQLVVTHVLGGGTTLVEADAAVVRQAQGPEWTARWVRLPGPPRGPDAASLLAQVTETSDVLARRKFDNRIAGASFEVLGVVFTEEVRQGVHADAWAFLLFQRPPRNGRPVVPTLLRAPRFGRAVVAERIPELGVVGDKKAAVVGLGSLGAPTTVELARAGVGTVAIMEPDHVDPGTAVRWSYGFSAASVLKAAVLADRLSRDHPFTDIVPSGLRVGAAPPDGDPTEEATELEAWANDAQVLIDATAEDNVSRVVNEIGMTAGVAQIYVWSIDGYGGVVARVTPGVTGCYHCLSLAMADGTIEPPPPADDNAGIRVQPRGCADPTFTAANVDLAPLAIQAARLALATLCRDAPGGYPDFDHDVLVLQVREPDGRPIPPRWTGYALERRDDCGACSG